MGPADEVGLRILYPETAWITIRGGTMPKVLANMWAIPSGANKQLLLGQPSCVSGSEPKGKGLALFE
jgi:hypothetical protein